MKENIIKKYFLKQKGFTMTELLIVMFIISLLSASVLISYRNNQRSYALDQASQQLVSNLRKAQNMAMNKVDIDGYNSYGIYAVINNNYYIIYADNNGDSRYQPSDRVIETINLLNNVKINNTLDVFFKSPDPKTYLNGNLSAGLSRTITLGVNGTSKTKIITITTAGLIQGN